MKKIAGLRKAFADGINHGGHGNHVGKSVDGVCAGEPEINDSLHTGGFTLAKVGRYGFPYHATCLALDSVQKLIAIGTASGAIRICGKPGVEFHVNHETNATVTILLFLINEGGLVSVCSDASLHIWSIRQKEPALIHSLNFKKERITALHNPFGSKWLYVGTERGNIYIVHVETFKVSGYVISWNHVIDVSCKTHPGPVNEISSNPQDPNKLLLNFESGVCCLWDLRSKKPQQSYVLPEASQYVTSVTWHDEGRQFMTGHWDGGLCTWNYKNPKKPEERQVPHSTGRGNTVKDKDGMCCPITKVVLLPAAGDVSAAPIIFSGGMPYGNKNKGLTMMRGRSKTLLLSECVVDFQCLVATPVGSDVPEPQAIFVLLSKEIVVFDLLEHKAASLPWFSVPYTFDIHESPVTCLQLCSECPSDLLTSFHSVKMHTKEVPNQSKHPWPLTGGQEGEISQAASVIITGHADGSIKFWDATSNLLIPCYKLSISRLFEKATRKDSVNSDKDYSDDPYAIQHIGFCPYGRVLTTVCQSYFVVVFKFYTQETIIETVKVDVNFSIEVAHDCMDSPTSGEFSLNDSFSAETGSFTNISSAPDKTSLASLTSTYHPPLKTIGIKWPYGFQPEIVCQQLAFEPMPNITVVTVSSGYGLMAFGNTLGIAIVDYVQKTTVMVIQNYELSVAGEWTDPVSAIIPPSPSSEKDIMVNGFPERKPTEKKKERVSRMLTSDYGSGHAKLSKKGSCQSLHSMNGGSEDSGGAAPVLRKEDKDLYVNAGSTEAIMFAYSYTRKSGNLRCPCMWVGTSQGTIAVITLSIPPAGEQRRIQPVLALCTGTLIDAHNSIVKVSILDQCGNIFLSPFNSWRDQQTDITKNAVQTSTTESCERQFVAVVTEKQIIVKYLPTLKQFATVDPVPESAYVVRADTMIIESGNAVGCLTTDGTLKIYSLPTLTLLLDVECEFSLADYRLIRTFALGKGGEAAFFASPTEIQRLVFTKEKELRFVDDHGCLFTLCQIPETKQKGFFESFFSGGGPSPLDRDDLFGAKSGNSRKVADYVPGSGLNHFRASADTAAGAIAKARMALVERGEKLSELEDRAANMNMKASQFASASKALADKYQRKKWYQL